MTSFTKGVLVYGGSYWDFKSQKKTKIEITNDTFS